MAKPQQGKTTCPCHPNAMGHLFDEDAQCQNRKDTPVGPQTCGTTWDQHQAKPTKCTFKRAPGRGPDKP